MAQMSPLRRRMIEDMTLRNLSRQTQESYIYAIAKFTPFQFAGCGATCHSGIPNLAKQYQNKSRRSIFTN